MAKNNNSNTLGSRFLLLQINDSLFPVGAYSHSYGLETYIQRGLVTNAAQAAAYIEKRLLCNFCYTDLLAARLAFDYARGEKWRKLDELEDIMEASRVPKELREASRRIGSRFVKTLAHMNISAASGVFFDEESFRQYLNIRRGKSTCHPCVYGAFCACAGMERQDALANYLYAQASAMATCCVKTVPLSQSDGQRILFSLGGVFETALHRAQEAGEEMLCASTPGFDLRSIQHERLYSRLYMS